MSQNYGIGGWGYANMLVFIICLYIYMSEYSIFSSLFRCSIYLTSQSTIDILILLT